MHGVNRAGLRDQDTAPMSSDALSEGDTQQAGGNLSSGSRDRRGSIIDRALRALSFDIAGRSTTNTLDLCASSSVIGLIFIGILCGGLDNAVGALMAMAAWSICLLGLCRSIGIRRRLLQSRLLLTLGVLFVGLLASVLWPLVRWPDADQALAARTGVVDRSSLLVEACKLAGLATAFMTGMIVGGTDRRAAMFFRGLCFAGGAYGLITLGLFMFDPAGDALAATNGYEHRLSCTLPSANVAAALFGIIAIVQLAYGTFKERQLPTVPGEAFVIVQYGTLILMMTCIVLTASRMTTVAFGISVVALAGLTSWSARRDDFQWRAIRPHLVLLGVFCGLVAAGQLLISRISTASDSSDSRAIVFRELWRAVNERPIGGFGLGSFSAIHAASMTTQNFKLLWNIRAGHNTYLQWLAEAGVIGSVLIVAILILVIREIAIGERVRSSMKWIMRSVVCASCLLFVQGLSDFSLQVPAISILWSVMLGSGFAVATGGSREVQAIPDLKPVWTGFSRTPAVMLLAVGCEVFALTLIVAGLPIAVHGRFPIVLRTAYDAVAYEQSGRDPGPERDALIRSSTNGALREFPLDAYAWMMRADIDRALPGGPVALSRSYRAAPFDATLFKWRVSLAAEMWDRLRPEDRLAVIEDIRAERPVFWSLRDWLNDLQRRYNDQPFGLAVQLVISELDRPAPS